MMLDYSFLTFFCKQCLIYWSYDIKLHNGIILKKIFPCFQIKNGNLIVTSGFIGDFSFVGSAGGYDDRLGGQMNLVEDNQELIFYVPRWISIEGISIYFSPFDQYYPYEG